MNVKILVRHFRKCLLIMVVGAVILFAVSINAARLVIPVLNHKRDFFERWASHVLHQPVYIKNIKTGWCGFNPALSFQDVLIADPSHETSLLRISQLFISIDLFHSLFHWRLLPGYLVLSGAHFDVSETENGELRVRGMTSFSHEHVLTDLGDVKNILLWMLKQSNVTLKAININYHTLHGNLIPISNLCVKVINRVLDHQIAGVGSLSQEVPTQFRFLVITSSKNTSLYVGTKNVIFKQWLDSYLLQKYLKNLSVSSGEGDIQLWAKFQKGVLKSLQSLIASSRIRLTVNKSHLLSIDRFSANLYWQSCVHGWRLLSNHVFLRVGEKQWPEYSFDVRVIYENSTPRILFKTNYLRLRDIRPFTKMVGYWPEKFQKLYQKIQPSGKLDHFSLFYFSRKKKPYYHLKTDFSALSFQPWDNLPGSLNLAGSIELTPSRGKLQLQSNATKIKAPKIFKNPMILKQLNITTQWYHDSTGWNIDVSRAYYVVNDDWQWWGKGRLSLPPNKSPYVSFQGKFKLKNLNSIKSYFPYHYISSNLSSWLNKAFVCGKVTAGIVDLKGPLKKFPFAHKEGHFDIVADVNGVVLHYNPKWPNLQNIHGIVAFHNDGFSIIADRAEIMGNPLNHLKGTIAHWAKPILRVSGGSISNLTNGFHFLRATPLLVAKKIKTIIPSGPLKVNLNLKIPLSQHDTDSKVYGYFFVNNAQIFLTDWGIKLTQITGNFHFINENFLADHIGAQFLGSPIDFSIFTINPSTSSPVFQIEMSAQVTAKALQKQFNLPILDYLSGSASYRALLKLHSDNDPVDNSFSLITDLIGTKSTLPFPYAKLAQDPALLNSTLFFHDNKTLVVKVHYSNLLAVKADTWIGLSSQHQGWRVNIKSPSILGDFLIPTNQRQWQGDFLRLYLPQKIKDNQMEWNLKEFPPIDLTINDFRYGKNSLGKLILKTSRAKTGLNIDNLIAAGPLFYIEATGKWQRKKNQTETRLVGRFVSPNLGAFLKKWGITQLFEGGKGRADFSLQWLGSPDQFAVAHLNGDIKIKFYHGRVIELMKRAEFELSFGRLLNLFNLQSLPKLPINLANFSKKGFVFNLFKGNFSLFKGIAKTEDTSLLGDIAWVQIKGFINFMNKNYDFHLKIVPNITSTLPLIVGLAGGPLAGVVTWVANQVLAPHIGKAAEVNYHIVGSWNKPVVTLTDPVKTNFRVHLN